MPHLEQRPTRCCAGSQDRHAARTARARLDIHPAVFGVGLTARRLPPLAPQVSQVGNSAVAEWEAVTLRLDHAFGFEFADVSSAAIEELRQCRCADGRGLLDHEREVGLETGGWPMVAGSVIAFVPVASR